MTNKRLVIDRRDLDRLKCEFDIEFQMHGLGEMFSGHVINLSSNGLCMLTNTSVHKGEYLNFFFPFFTGTQMIPSKVVRTEGREVAVQFDLDESELDRFAEAFNTEYSSRHNSKFLRL